MAQSQSNLPMTGRTGFQRDMLIALSRLDGEPSGQDVSRALEQAGYDAINHGRLYANLDELEEDGLVDRWEVDGRTNGYGLTERGEQAIAADLRWRVSAEVDA